MIVLGIESATVELGAAVVEESSLSSLVRVRSDRRHVELLSSVITEALSFANVGLSELDAIAVDIGPGRFTGIRAGMASAKALGYALSLPLVGIRSTEALLFGTDETTRPIVAVVDLRRGELAVEHSEDGGPRQVARTTPEQLRDDLIERYSTSGARLVGDGARRYESLLSSPAHEISVSSESLAPDVGALARLGAIRALLGEGASGELEALYLKDADVRISWKTRDDEPVAT